MKCHEKIDSNERSNYLLNEEGICDSIERLFVKVAEDVEKGHDFNREIKCKKDMQKERIIREIKERLSFLNEENNLPRNVISNVNVVSNHSHQLS